MSTHGSVVRTTRRPVPVLAIEQRTLLAAEEVMLGRDACALAQRLPARLDRQLVHASAELRLLLFRQTHPEARVLHRQHSALRLGHAAWDGLEG